LITALHHAGIDNGIAMPDLIIELQGLRDAASLTRFNITKIRPALPEIGERGVDVLFELDGRRLGAQHTIFHSDEGHTPSKRGSALRGKEKKSTSWVTQQPPGMFGKFDYRPALLLRVEEKIAKAARHDNDELIAETWLVISANLGKEGAASSTMIAPAALRVDDLNALCHSQLAGSKFECALLVLHLDKIVYGWDHQGGWRLLADPGAAAREFGPSDRAYAEELVRTQGWDKSVLHRQVQRILRELRHGPSR